MKLEKENPAGCAGKGKQSKKIRRREKDGLFHQLHFVMKLREEGLR